MRTVRKKSSGIRMNAYAQSHRRRARVNCIHHLLLDPTVRRSQRAARSSQDCNWRWLPSQTNQPGRHAEKDACISDRTERPVQSPRESKIGVDGGTGIPCGMNRTVYPSIEAQYSSYCTWILSCASVRADSTSSPFSVTWSYASITACRKSASFTVKVA